MDSEAQAPKYLLQLDGCGSDCHCYHLILWEIDGQGNQKRMAWDSSWVSEPLSDKETEEYFVDSVLTGLSQFRLTLKSKDCGDYWEWECVSI